MHMFGAYPESAHMPCPECGVSLQRHGGAEHVCDEQRLLEFRLFQLRDEIASFDAQLSEWLASARGRFATWIAERDRLAGPNGLAA
jgi:hypothetical protein